MKSKLLKGFLAVAMSICLTACGSNNQAETSSQENRQSQEEKTEENKEQTSEENQENSDDKKLDGKLTVYMPSPTNLNTAYIEGFEKKTGLKVELFEGTTGEIQARLQAEKDNPVADVVVLASWSDGLSLKNQGDLMAYPEAENLDKMHDGWVDDDKMLFGTSASALGVIYNTSLIDNLEADWSELADPKYKDMIAIPDPEKSGSCKDFLAGYMYATNNDWSTWEKMAQNGLTVAGANKAALEAVTTGEKSILVAGVDYNAYSKINKGEPLNIYYPKSGTVINPRPAMIIKTSQNVENAKAFIDYLMSDEAQKMVTDAYLLAGRSDIKADNRTNVSEIPTFEKLDWNEMMKNSSNIAAKLNQIIN